MSEESVKSHFLPRHGQDPYLQGLITKDESYTDETLSYMASSSKADLITKRIEDAYNKAGYSDKFLIIDAFAGIGGNTISFLDSQRTGMVISFEIESKRAEMLKRNITLYNLGEKSEVFNTPFTIPNFSDKGMCGSTIYVDVPWIVPDVPVPNGERYATSGLYLSNFYIEGNPTLYPKIGLEDFVAYLTQFVFMIVLHVPPNYIMNNVNGWTMETETYGKNKNARSYFYTNQAYTLQYLNGFKGGMLGPSVDITNKSNKILAYSGYQLPQPKVIQIFPTMPARANPTVPISLGVSNVINPISISQAPILISGTTTESKGSEISSNVIVDKTKKYKPNSFTYLKEFGNTLPKRQTNYKADNERWLTEFREYLRVLLSKIIDDNEILNRMIGNGNDKMEGAKVMATWTRAFTHMSADPNDYKNYELLETIGDAVLAYVFTCWLAKRELSKDAITQLMHRYMTNEFQPKFARYLKLDQWLILNDVNNVAKSTYEDIFESFSGAMHEIGEIVSPGVGPLLVRNFINLIFENEILDDKFKRGTAITIVTQVYIDGLHWPKFKQTYEYPNGFVEATITVPKEVTDFINTNYKAGKGLSSAINNNEYKIVGLRENVFKVKVIQGDNAKEEAKSLVYDGLFKALEDSGLTYEEAQRWRDEMALTGLDQAVKARLLAKANGSGFSLVHFIVNPKGFDDGTVILMGTKEFFDDKGKKRTKLEELARKVFPSSVPRNKRKEELAKEYSENIVIPK